MEPVAKPAELLAARAAAAGLFALLQRWFEVPATVTLDLKGVDPAAAELDDPTKVAAITMRKLQRLHRLASPGVVTTTDVVLTVLAELERTLVQVPRLYLRTTAAETDWDAALAALDFTAPDGTDADGEPEGLLVDEEIETFRAQHQVLHQAARAVLRVSDGRIRTLA